MAEWLRASNSSIGGEVSGAWVHILVSALVSKRNILNMYHNLL